MFCQVMLVNSRFKKKNWDKVHAMSYNRFRKEKKRNKNFFQIIDWLIDYFYLLHIGRVNKICSNYFWEFGKRLILQHFCTCTCCLCLKCIDVELSWLSSTNDEQDQHWSNFYFIFLIRDLPQTTKKLRCKCY